MMNPDFPTFTKYCLRSSKIIQCSTHLNTEELSHEQLGAFCYNSYLTTVKDSNALNFLAIGYGAVKMPRTVGGPAQWLLCTSTDHGHSYTLGRGQFPKSIKPGPLHICLISGNLNGLGIHTPNCFGRCWDFFTYRPPLKKITKTFQSLFCV